MAKVLVLHSGGADSTLLLYMAALHRHEVQPLAYRYGQKHEKELDFARRAVGGVRSLWSKQPDIEDLRIIDLTSVFYNIQSNLLTKSVKTEYPGVHEMHVPGRNSIFLSVALGLAETEDFDEIWIGCDHSDRINNFPDCYQEYIVRMDKIATIAGSRPIRIKAPLMGFHKEDVLAHLEAVGIDTQKLYSGYEPPKTQDTAQYEA